MNKGDIMDDFETKSKRPWLRWTIILVVLIVLTVVGLHLFSRFDFPALHAAKR
jgi:flagellar basal body-associated protein FliL